jgi:hypothetical protein
MSRPDDGGSTHLRNVCQFQRDYTALYTRRLLSSYTTPWESEISLNNKSNLIYFSLPTLSFLLCFHPVTEINTNSRMFQQHTIKMHCVMMWRQFNNVTLGVWDVTASVEGYNNQLQFTSELYITLMFVAETNAYYIYRNSKVRQTLQQISELISCNNASSPEEQRSNLLPRLQLLFVYLPKDYFLLRSAVLLKGGSIPCYLWPTTSSSVSGDTLRLTHNDRVYIISCAQPVALQWRNELFNVNKLIFFLILCIHLLCNPVLCFLSLLPSFSFPSLV